LLDFRTGWKQGLFLKHHISRVFNRQAVRQAKSDRLLGLKQASVEARGKCGQMRVDKHHEHLLVQAADLVLGLRHAGCHAIYRAASVATGVLFGVALCGDAAWDASAMRVRLTTLSMCL